MNQRATLISLVIAAFAPVFLCSAGRAAIEGEAKVKDVAQTLMPYFAEKPDKSLSSHFHPEFLKNHPATEIEQHFRSIYAHGGKATAVNIVKMREPFAAEVEFVMQKDCRLPMTLGLEKTPPHRIDYLLFHKLVSNNERFDDIKPDLENLPGTVAYSLVKLGGGAPRTIWSQNGDKPLAVGSTFKLCVFATLVDEIAKGKRKWEDLVPVHKEWASLPAGLVQDWPDKSPVTLCTLATLMISKSDNTAADHLINVLGRERIEAMQRSLGIRHPERNLPLMTTAEALKIKLVCAPDVQEQYANADTTERRKLLDTAIKFTPLTRPRPPGLPVKIDKIDWFFSTSDLCRILDWLRQQERVPYVKEMLAIDEWISADKQYWKYVGYKGGAEPGVLTFTLLLQNSKGDWFAFAITWNDPEQDIKLDQLMKLTERLVRSAQKL
jgi:hypothetical protein